MSMSVDTNMNVDICINLQRESRSFGFSGRTAYRVCYWIYESSSVLEGSSFSSFCTSLSYICVFLMFLLTPSRSFDSLVVSLPISTVMPLILFTMRFHLIRDGMKEYLPDQILFQLECVAVRFFVMLNNPFSFVFRHYTLNSMKPPSIVCWSCLCVYCPILCRQRK